MSRRRYGRAVKRFAAGLSASERRIVIAVCVISAASMLSSSTINYIVNPMVADLDASESQQALLRQLPSIGSLLVIFVAGAVGLRVGARRFLMGCAAVMTLGYVITMVAPGITVASLGLLIGSIGRQGLVVIAIGLLSSQLSSADARATGFSSVGAVAPSVYLVAPALAGVLVGSVGWRPVLLIWVLGAVGAAWVAARMLPHDPPRATEASAAEEAGPRELWTPALAGLVLAALIQGFNSVSDAGWGSTQARTWFGLAAAAMVVLAVAMRRMAQPTLDLSMLRSGGMLLLLVVMLLIPFVNLWFYVTVGLQQVYGYSAVETALLMTPAQLAGMAAAAIASRLIKRRGLVFTGAFFLFISSAMLLLCVVQTVSTPVWIPVAIVSVYAGAAVGAGIAVTNAVMNLAPEGKQGDVAAFRGASASLGAALGVVLMTGIVVGTFQTSLTNQLAAAGQDPSQVAEVSASLREGLSTADVSSLYSVPTETVDDVDDEQKQAMVHAYRAQGLAGSAITVVAALLFLLQGRRSRRAVQAGAGADSTAQSTGGTGAKAERNASSN